MNYKIRKMIYYVFDIILSIFLFILSNLIIRIFPYLILKYESNELNREILVIYEYNLQGFITNWIYNDETLKIIPFLGNVFVLWMSVIYMIFIYILILSFFIGNVKNSYFLESRKQRIITIIVVFLTLLSLYLILLLCNYLRIDQNIEIAYYHHELERQFNPNIVRTYQLSISPDFINSIAYPFLLIVFKMYIHDSLYKFFKDKNFRLIHEDNLFISFIKNVKNDKIEEPIWDFKETLEMWNKKLKGHFKQKWQVDFCEHIASFANSQGGLLIIGVTDKLPRKIIGLDDIENQKQDCSRQIQNWVIYKEKFFRIKDLSIKDDNEIERNCILIFIAQTKEPIGVRTLNQTISYKVRLSTGREPQTYERIKEMKTDVIKLNYSFLEELITFRN